MAEPFLGEIRLMSFGFPPKGWALCNGQLLPINQNQALFSLLGTTYGGDGRVNFALPNLQGRAALHFNGSFPQGSIGGEQAHTLSINEMPTHTHRASASSAAASTPAPTGGVLASAANVYGGATALTSLQSGTITSVGGSQAHPNMQPFTVINFSIALQGIFPSPN
ncbi:MAG: phage tail protein [Candidatus Competibacter sp.]|nr:phage tail protein [Candidatus Competibacter sp.]